MTDDLDFWGQPDGMGAKPYSRAGGRSADTPFGLGVVWVGPQGGPSPAAVRRFYRRHPVARRRDGVSGAEVCNDPNCDGKD
jgi:hypothetical protein